MNYIKTQTSNKGFFNPKNKQKYTGEYPIRIMSSWEEKIMTWLDNSPSVIKWTSESIEIPYYDPVTTKDRRYYPDILAKIKNKSGEIDTWLIEVKPQKDVKTKSNRGKSKKTQLYEQKTQLTNKAKFKAAQRYCKLRGWKFKIITEKELFGKQTN